MSLYVPTDLFLSRLAHELRNQIAPILTAAQILKRPENLNPEKVAWATGIIEKKINQSVRMLDDIADLALIVRDELTLKTQKFDLNALILSAVEASRQDYAQRGQQVCVFVPESVLWVTGDDGRLFRIFHNLFFHAAASAPNSGRIEITLERFEKNAVLILRNNGFGFLAHESEALFELCGHPSRDTGMDKPGLGLALPLAKAIVELHGGTIDAPTAGEGNGRELSVKLPLELETQAD